MTHVPISTSAHRLLPSPAVLGDPHFLLTIDLLMVVHATSPPGCLQRKNADEVEFWHSPDKDGWLHSQGEVIKTWRKRWFVLKDGYLFRFLDDKVTPTSKPRGIIDLEKVRNFSLSSWCCKLGFAKSDMLAFLPQVGEDSRM
jgi:hypothetical protein